jgi:hypothetical protein
MQKPLILKGFFTQEYFRKLTLYSLSTYYSQYLGPFGLTYKYATFAGDREGVGEFA